MKNLRLYHGGHGPLLPIIGGRIGMAHTVVHMEIRIVVHMRMTQCITKDLDTLLIKSQDRGVEQVATRMRVLRQKADMLRHQVDMLRHQEGLEGIVEVDMLEGTANQCGG